jgi:hypothetical protein
MTDLNTFAKNISAFSKGLDEIVASNSAESEKLGKIQSLAKACSVWDNTGVV